MAPAPLQRFCAEKQQLIDSFTKAVSDYVRMQSAQALALVEGLGFAFEKEIRDADNEKIKPNLRS